MAALDGAVALPQVDDVAVPVAQDLHFDVPRLFDVLLQIDTTILECFLGFLAGGLQAGAETDVVAGYAHAAPAAARRRLDEHWETQGVGQLESFGVVFN